MLWIAERPEAYSGQVVGNGHCVAFVRAASMAPHTSEWQAGALRRDRWPTGCAIATFDDDGTYGNHTDGRSHTAILIEVQAEGLRVWDQWRGHPVAQRTIRFKAGQGQACDDGSRYSAVTTAEPPAAA